MIDQEFSNKPAVRSATRRAALHLIPREAPGSGAEAEAQVEASDLVRTAIIMCVRGNRPDLAERLLEVAATLPNPGAGQRAKTAETVAPQKARRKLAKPSPGYRARKAARDRGAATITLA